MEVEVAMAFAMYGFPMVTVNDAIGMHPATVFYSSIDVFLYKMNLIPKTAMKFAVSSLAAFHIAIGIFFLALTSIARASLVHAKTAMTIAIFSCAVFQSVVQVFFHAMIVIRMAIVTPPPAAIVRMSVFHATTAMAIAILSLAAF